MSTTTERPVEEVRADALRGPWHAVLADRYGDGTTFEDFDGNETDPGDVQVSIVRGTAAPAAGERLPGTYRSDNPYHSDDLLIQLDDFEEPDDVLTALTRAQAMADGLNRASAATTAIHLMIRDADRGFAAVRHPDRPRAHRRNTSMTTPDREALLAAAARISGNGEVTDTDLHTLALSLLDIAETAMPDTYFAEDSRCQFARAVRDATLKRAKPAAPPIRLNIPMVKRLRACAADTSSNWAGTTTIHPPEARDLVALIDRYQSEE